VGECRGTADRRRPGRLAAAAFGLAGRARWFWAVGRPCGNCWTAQDRAARAREGGSSGAGAQTDRRRAAVCRTAGARAGRCTTFIGGRGSGTGRGSAGRLEDDRAAPYGVGQGSLERTDGPPGVPGRTARGARRKGQDFEAASVGAWPGEGRPRDAAGWARTSRRGRRGAASPARKQFTAPLFRRKNLQKLE
jgi:hypothetical protein